MRKQCVPGAPPFFARAGDEATTASAAEGIIGPGLVYTVPRGVASTCIKPFM